MEQLSKRTGKTPGEIVEEAIDLYEVYFIAADPSLPPAEKAIRLIENPVCTKIFSDRQSALNRVNAQKIPKADRQSRAQAAGSARAKKLTPSKRKEIARKAAQARWQKEKTENG